MWGELAERIVQVDPAARSRLEVVLCYPGFHVLIFHSMAHWLWRQKLVLPARFISHIGRVLTGIEIHPGAQIGRRVFIDHGMGVVIGETAIVGDDVVIYQGVTLGGGEKSRMGALTRGKKRHPTLGRGVVVGSAASILGDISIGDNCRIASGAVVLKDIPPDSIVVGVPGRVISGSHKDQNKEETPLSLETLTNRLNKLEEQVQNLTNQSRQEHGAAKIE